MDKNKSLADILADIDDLFNGFCGLADKFIEDQKKKEGSKKK